MVESLINSVCSTSLETTTLRIACSLGSFWSQGMISTCLRRRLTTHTLRKAFNDICISSSAASCRSYAHISQEATSNRTRNIGIIAHIDAVSGTSLFSNNLIRTDSTQGKTTTTERMLYYSGFTRRIGGECSHIHIPFLPAAPPHTASVRHNVEVPAPVA